MYVGDLLSFLKGLKELFSRYNVEEVCDFHSRSDSYLLAFLWNTLMISFLSLSSAGLGRSVVPRPSSR